MIKDNFVGSYTVLGLTQQGTCVYHHIVSYSPSGAATQAPKHTPNMVVLFVLEGFVQPLKL